MAARASQLPENVRNLTVDIRKSYEDLMKSKKTESIPVLACRSVDSTTKKKIIENKNTKTNDDDEENEKEYEDDDEFENENEEEKVSIHMNDDDDQKREEEQDGDVMQTDFNSTILPVERYNGDDMFLWNVDNAVKRVLELKDEKDIQKQNDFSTWKNKKDAEKKEKEEKDVSTLIHNYLIIFNFILSFYFRF